MRLVVVLRVSSIGRRFSNAQGRGESPTHRTRANSDLALRRLERREWKSPLAPVKPRADGANVKGA